MVACTVKTNPRILEIRKLSKPPYSSYSTKPFASLTPKLPRVGCFPVILEQILDDAPEGGGGRGGGTKGRGRGVVLRKEGETVMGAERIEVGVGEGGRKLADTCSKEVLIIQP